MHKKIRYNCYSLVVFLFISLLISGGTAFSAGQSSDNYTMQLDVFDGGGGWCTSTNYGISHATGQSTPIGYSESSSYRVYAGFFFPAIWYVPTITLPTLKSSILAPSGLGFGEVATGSSRNLNLIMNNTKNTTINVGTVILPSTPYSITADGCNGVALSPGDTCSITVRFSPVSVGNFYSYMLIPTDDPDAGIWRVNLSGAGVSE
jgi:hypothetical protein